MENQNNPNERIIELIKKCLALSSSSNEHEAEFAMSKAQELIEKYNLKQGNFRTFQKFFQTLCLSPDQMLK